MLTQLIIDISSLVIHDDNTGIHRCLKNIIKYLPLVSKNVFECVFAGHKEWGGILYEVKWQNQKWSYGTKIVWSKGDVLFKPDLNPSYFVHDYYTTIKNYGVKIISLVYDITFILYPEFIYDKGARDNLILGLNYDIQHSDAILAISKAIEYEIRIYSQKADLITGYNYWGSDFYCTMTRTHDQGNKRFKFLTVSTVEPRKAYFELVKAFENLLDRGFDAELLIVGKDGWKNEKDKGAILNSKYYGSRLVWNNHCDDEQLLKYYSEADCFVFASYYEGFGLGLIEAARCGIPLLLRDLPVFYELAGDNALYFDGYHKTLEKQLIYCVNHKTELPDPSKINVMTWKESMQHLSNELQRLIKLIK